MADDKPCISELYESGGLDMDLVGKIAHNELDKRKALLPNSDHALASEYIDFYIDVNYSEIIERYTEVLDTELSAEDFRNGEISPEFVLGLAIARCAESHASAISNTSPMSFPRGLSSKSKSLVCLPCGASAGLPMISRSPGSIPIRDFPSDSFPSRMSRTRSSSSGTTI